MGDLKDTHPHYVFASLDSELAAALPAEAETPTLPGRSSDSPKTTPVGTTLTETPRWLPKDSPTHTVSTAFPPDQDSPVDIVLISSDHVLFYTQTSQLIEVSDNALDGHLVGEATTSSSSPAVVSIPETSEVLNVVLHAIFSKSSNQYNPLLATLLSATYVPTSDISVDALRSALGGAEKELRCELCKESLFARIEEISVHWTTKTRTTI